MASLPVSYTTVLLCYETLPDLRSATNVESKVVYAHAGRAQAIVNAKVVRRYNLPFALTPPLIESITTDLTIYSVLAKTAIIANTTEDGSWPKAYKESMDLLGAIANGSMMLVDSAGAVIAQRTDQMLARSSSETYVPTFSELPPEQAVIDSDKIDDLENERSA